MTIRAQYKPLALFALLLFGLQQVLAAVPQLPPVDAVPGEMSAMMDHGNHCSDAKPDSGSMANDAGDCGNGCLCCLGGCTPFSLQPGISAEALLLAGSRFDEPLAFIPSLLRHTLFRPPISR